MSLTRLLIPSCLSPPHSISLLGHHHLTCITLSKVDLIELLPCLPRYLRSLTASLHRPLNLANPKNALTLQSMNRKLPHLKELTLTMLFQNDGSETYWLEPLSATNSPLITASQWITLPTAITKLYTQYYLATTPLKAIISQESLNHASEIFVLSCLPRGLSVLKLPEISLFDTPRSTRMLILRRIALATLKYQLPLLGLPLHDCPFPRADDFIYAALHPTLSSFSVGREQLHGVSIRLGRIDSGFDKSGFADPQARIIRVVSETSYHIVNAATWLLIAVYGPSNWKQHLPLRAYILSTALGSAIAAPLVLWRLINSGVKPNSFQVRGATAFAHHCFCLLYGTCQSTALFWYWIDPTWTHCKRSSSDDCRIDCHVRRHGRPRHSRLKIGQNLKPPLRTDTLYRLNLRRKIELALSFWISW